MGAQGKTMLVERWRGVRNERLLHIEASFAFLDTLESPQVQPDEVRQRRHCECNGVKLQTAPFKLTQHDDDDDDVDDVKRADDTPASLTLPMDALQSALVL
ncbi:Hypothetical predicted protein [Scomber scombrus]|uniref:Uncharacterized protein n=1 Tax=Scomber scombrus TaxID=13677 RepID=A0AAV1PUY8_SCOSC